MPRKIGSGAPASLKHGDSLSPSLARERTSGAPTPSPRRRGPAAATLRAVERIRAGETAYAAAKAEGLALSTIYRSSAYKALVSS
jgi:hypothetical protein